MTVGRRQTSQSPRVFYILFKDGNRYSERKSDGNRLIEPTFRIYPSEANMSPLMAFVNVHTQTQSEHGSVNVDDAMRWQMSPTYMLGLKLPKLAKSQVGSLCGA